MEKVVYRAGDRQYDLRILRDRDELVSVELVVSGGPHSTIATEILPLLSERTAGEIVAVADGLVQAMLPEMPERRGAFGAYRED